MKTASNLFYINVYGNSLEAKAIASCLAKSGFNVTACKGLHCDLTSHENQIAAEPGLISYLSESKRVGLLVSQRDSRNIGEIHWVVYKGKNRAALVDFILHLLEGKTTSQKIILTTNLEVGTHSLVKFEVDKLSESNGVQDHHEVITIPTFIREGTAIDDFNSPPLLLIGIDSKLSKSLISKLLRDTLQSANEVRFMSGSDVEVVNNAVSAFLAMRVSFINELAILLESKGISFMPIVDAMSCDPRFGRSYNKPGCGYGGVALQEAVLNMQTLFKGFDAGSLMMKATLDINEDQKDLLFRKFWQFYGSDLYGKKVGIWGATFRANTASLINSPVINLTNALISESVEVSLYDPMINSGTFDSDLFDGPVQILDSKYEAIKDKDALFIVTDWDEFKYADLKMVKRLLNEPVIFDGRNIYEMDKVNKLGLNYFGIGRNNSKG